MDKELVMKFMLSLVIPVLLTATSFNSKASLPQCGDSECVEYFNEYQKYAKKGYADALNGIGQMYYYGYGTDRNVEKAITSLKAAARYGSSTGAFNLGKIYLSDPEVGDIDEALRYLKRGANREHLQSAILLGVIHSDASFNRVDHEETDKWLAKAYNISPRKASKYLVNVYNSNAYSADKFEAITEIIENNENVKVVKTADGSTKKNKIQIEWPNEDNNAMEIIAVSAPTVENIMDAELSSLASGARSPEKYNVGTGSRIRGRRCQDIQLCNPVDIEDYKRKLIEKYVTMN
jgi:hypothetical protein